MHLTPDAAIELAAAIADRLRRDALHDGSECTWLGHHSVADAASSTRGTGSVRSLLGDVYGGTAGVALFLLELHHLRPEPWLPDLIRAALAHATRTIADAPKNEAGGFLTGVAGLGYVNLRAAEILADPAAARAGLAQLSVAAVDACVAEGAVDLVSGVAGVVVAAAAASRRTPALRDVVAAGQNALLAAATREGGAWSWNMTAGQAEAKSEARTGLSHGFSGVAAALFAAHALTGDPTARDAAVGALVTEDRWYVPEQANWIDLRHAADATPPATPESRRAAPCADVWCHGAPGIAIVRRIARDVLGGDAPVAASLAPAVRITRRALRQWREGADTSLCHGLFGHAECLMLAAPGAYLPTIDGALARAARSHAEDASWPSGVVSRGANPSLLLGSAGIGHQLLRWAKGNAVPPVLLPSAVAL